MALPDAAGVANPFTVPEPALLFRIVIPAPLLLLIVAPPDQKILPPLLDTRRDPADKFGAAKYGFPALAPLCVTVKDEASVEVVLAIA